MDSTDMSWRNPGRWWRTGKPGLLQSMELQRFWHDWATERQQQQQFFFFFFFLITTHSSILAWRIPWADKSSGLQSMESQRVTNTHTKFHWGFLSGAVFIHSSSSCTLSYWVVFSCITWVYCYLLICIPTSGQLCFSRITLSLSECLLFSRLVMSECPVPDKCLLSEWINQMNHPWVTRKLIVKHIRLLVWTVVENRY